jgi:cell division protease FtsH
MKKLFIAFAIFALIFSGILYIFNSADIDTLSNGTKIINSIKDTKKIDLNTFLALYKSGSLSKIKLVDATKLEWYIPATGKIQMADIAIKNNIEQKFFNLVITNKPIDTSLSELWISLTWKTIVDINFNEANPIGEFLINQILPILLFIGIFMIFMKFFSPKGGIWLPFSMSIGKMKSWTDVKTKFNDVAGMEECKQELKEVIEFLKNPDKYKKVWARVPKWVLLWWAPWSGKTLLARAVAGEAWVPFYSASGSEFMEMLVGMWAAKVRELFNKAKATAPSIIFIDEIDSIGKKRGGGNTWGHQEQEQTLNQILTEMDGFERENRVIVIAATNRPDILDSALLRAGRFDRKVFVGRPTLEERKEIIELYLKWKEIDQSVNIDSLTKRTSGFVWADLENFVNEAALKTANDNREILINSDFEYALEKIIMGPEKKIKSLKEKERLIVAYHELWHAITGYFLPNCDPVEKISIVSRGMALGVTRMMPEEDRYLHSKAKFLDELVSLLGGRAAEEIFFGKEEITTWASNDFEKSTKIATEMIMKYGMDEELGQILYIDESKSDYSFVKAYSEKTAELIDKKIKDIIWIAYQKSLELISEHRTIIEDMKNILLEKEYIDREKFESMMKAYTQKNENNT